MLKIKWLRLKKEKVHTFLDKKIVALIDHILYKKKITLFIFMKLALNLPLSAKDLESLKKMSLGGANKDFLAKAQQIELQTLKCKKNLENG